MDAQDPTVKLSDITISRAENVILKNVNLSVDPGEFIYLIGKTGSGKSSLLKVLYADLEPAEGTGTVCGFDVRKIRQSKVPHLRRKLGIVFQDFELLSDRSVMNNLKFVMKATGWKQKKSMEERINEVLDQVGMGTKGYKFPHELSGGEQQRVAIARALVNHPDLILADEPTGNLDPLTTEGILSLLFEISRKGTSVIMATHDYSSMKKFAARTVKCVDGTLAEDAFSESYSSSGTPNQ
jgi:cell division transport system ATP-binding protein